MIDIDKMVETLNVTDVTTIDEMRAMVVAVLDSAKASNEAETALQDANDKLVKENERLTAQNLELFNRVTSSFSSSPTETTEGEEEEEEVTTDDILSYYTE